MNSKGLTISWSHDGAVKVRLIRLEDNSFYCFETFNNFDFKYKLILIYGKPEREYS